MRRRVATFFALLALLFLACAVYGPSLLAPQEAGADCPITGDAGDAGPSCNNAVWPGRPPKDDPATYAGGALVLPLQTIHLDPHAGRGNLASYDRDRTSTSPGTPSR